METLAVNLQPFFATDEEFLALCAQNPEIRFERKSTGVVKGKFAPICPDFVI